VKILFIGGTGLLSSACSELTVTRGHDLIMINRSKSTKYSIPPGARHFQADIRGDIKTIEDLLSNLTFDVVVDFIAFKKDDIERDLRLFKDRTRQFIFISSASAYQKPPKSYYITEDTPLSNPYWQYSRDKIACEERLNLAHRESGFPVTIIRPSLTYGPSQIPFIVGSWLQPWTNIARIKRGKKIIISGDGTSLWVLTWNADFAVGLVGLFGNLESIGQAYNITSDEVLTWNAIIAEAFSALEVDPNIVHIPSDLIAAYWPEAEGSLIGDKSNSLIINNDRIKAAVPDFHCQVNWAEGIRRSLAWFDAHPEHKTVDKDLDSLWDVILAAYEKAMP
jgi:nucleoside-diphosphate-sugar epimerase